MYAVVYVTLLQGPSSPPVSADQTDGQCTHCFTLHFYKDLLHLQTVQFICDGQCTPSTPKIKRSKQVVTFGNNFLGYG